MAREHQGGASAPPAILTVTETRVGSTFRTLRYADPGTASATFDGSAFMASWTRFVGSVHRHHETGALVLCWSTEGPHPVERENLRARLEAQPGRVGSVLRAVDRRDVRFDQWLCGRAA